MKSISIRRTPKTLTRPVGDLVAEGGKILVGDDAPRAAPGAPAVSAPADPNRGRRHTERGRRGS